MKIGIIGGSGLDDAGIIADYEELDVETPYGKPSSNITCGKISGVEVCILSRHGKKHEITPTGVNNRANIYALHKLGCTHIIATSAVGSLREEIMRGDFIILDQFIDFTKQRKITFHDDFKEGIKHTPMAEPFSEFLRKRAISACEELGIIYHARGTVVTIEGPRFSTRAESKIFRLWNADVVNMSIAPETILANELGVQYCAIAMSTDYDCWKEDEAPVTWDAILKISNSNAEKMKKLLVLMIEKLANDGENVTNKIQKWIKIPVLSDDIKAETDKKEVDKTETHEKGWGREEWIANNGKYCGKKLIIRKGGKCSVHFHKIKDETFFIQSGLVRMDLFPQQKDMTLVQGGYPNGMRQLILKPGDVLRMPQFTPHRFWGLEDSEMFEFSTQHYEEDSYRLEGGDSQKQS